jgi:predicted ATPase|tara:strand:+ start:156 stop:944 length:789 start_codon:yes stop_codon:yes gene_type:complete
MFLTSLALEDETPPDDYPFTVPCIKTLSKLAFDSPVTIFVGENGSGKSTLLEAIACGMKCPTIGLSDLPRDPMLAGARRLAKQLRLSRSNHPKVKLFFRAEDAIGFTRRMTENIRDLDELKKEFSENLTGYGRGLAVGAMEDQKAKITSRYGENPDALSHGEWFVNIIRERIHGKGLYLLDEPETPLSPIHQLSLLSIIKEAVSLGAQFLIATHSPIIMACEGATIYNLDNTTITKTAWEDVEHVSLMRAFLVDPSSFLRHL